MLSFLIWCSLCTFLVVKFVAIITKGYCRSNVCLVGRIAIITGGNSGLGYQTALNFASRGCRIIIADISDASISVKRIIEKTGNPNIFYKFLDLGSFAAVRTFAADFIKEENQLDFLINNAGCAGFTSKTDDGVFKVLQINYLSHFLLTHLLAPLLKQTNKSRVVFVSSLLAFAHDMVHKETINRLPTVTNQALQVAYTYGNSKFAMLAASDIFAQKFQKYGVLVSASHPGLIDTGIFTTTFDNLGNILGITMRLCQLCILMLVKFFSKTPVEGIQSTLQCALGSKVKSGDFIVDCRSFVKPRQLDDKLREEIWNESLRLAKVTQEEEVQ